MKRNVLTAAALTILYIRQLRYERRLSNRQGWWEREADRGLKREWDKANHGFKHGFKEVDEILLRWHREIQKEMAGR